MKLTVTLLLLLLLLCPALFSQSISLRWGTVHPKANITARQVDSFSKSVPRFANTAFGVIQFEQMPSAEERTALAASGIELLDYLPQHAFIAAFRGTLSAAALQRTHAKALLQLQPQQKMQEHFAKGTIPSWAVAIAGTVDVWVSFYKTLDASLVLQQLKDWNATILSTEHISYRVIALRIGANQLTELAAMPFIDYIQPAPPQDKPLNYNSRIGSRANVLNTSVANGGRGLNGEGVVIGHGDNADLQAHADFAGRLINRNASPFHAHGVHTAGTLAGAGIMNELIRGYAPKATVLSQWFSHIINYAPAYVQEYGMVITSNSYGSVIECDYHGTYDLTARILDEQAIDFPSLLHVFAAGNSGLNTCLPYPTSYRTVLGGYQSSKNSLTVGATNDTGTIAGFSSRGPVKDGRLKPEITAMGQGVISAWPTNTYSFNNGTSMAAPAVSGGAALLYQRYRQLHSGANPKNGLIKALLCNSATDRGAAGPDFQNGFGWMNLLRSVETLEQGRYFSDNCTHNNTKTHVITVPANTAQLKVLLYWNDVPASVISTKNLVNDLDLEVMDPSGTIVLPKILDTAMAALSNVAANGADRINNIEQVVINTPVAGTYTLRVKGSTVTTAQQPYVVVYDPMPVQLKITAPASGEALVPGETTKIYWESAGLSGNAAIDFSPDGGTTWTPVVAAIDITRNFYTWTIPAGITTNALVRITKTGSSELSVSSPFTIAGQPVLSLSPVQCEDYIAVNWLAVPGATDYEVMMLRGDEMKPIATTTSTTFTISGLSKDTLYFVSVRARINGKPGRRAFAISRQPNNGTCAGNISDKDIKLDAVLSPVTGRQETSTTLSAAETIRVRIKNLDDAPQTNINVSYTINGSAPVTETIAALVEGGATYEHAFATPVNFSATGRYTIRAFVNQNGDANAINDSLTVIVKHIENVPLTLNNYFVDNLETALPATYEKETLGLMGVERYDFVRTTPFSRLRTFVSTGIAASGNKAFTLDASRFQPMGNTSYLIGTFNLRQYNVAGNDIRLDFMYRHHRQVPNPANRVWIRGSDTEPWIEVYNLDSVLVEEGLFKRVKSIEVSNFLAANGQDLSGSFQVRWGQWGIWPATDAENAAGYTIDDIRLYQSLQDVQVMKIDLPATNNCSLGAAAQVAITVRNSSNTALTNVPVRYRVNGGTFISETIAAIPPRISIPYSFANTTNLSANGAFTIQAVVDLPGDSFRENDTATTVIINQPLVTTFPYLQNFETGNGNFYTGGQRSSWEYGTPDSRRISGAASGARAWKTNLQGTYNDREFSYLYSPCFDISSLSVPTLSFSLALDIEDCGTALCDAAWVEFSTDGINWQKLRTDGNGTNWYNKGAPRNQWSTQTQTIWRVATQALPTGLSRLRLRFVFASDAGVSREGIAIDDVHIYDNQHGIYTGPTLSQPVTQIVSGNNWINFLAGGKLVASVQPLQQNLGNTAVQVYTTEGTVPFSNNQYYLNRNITIKPTNKLTDTVLVRFYFLDSETDSLLKATGCPTCTKPESAYELGVTQYTDPNKAAENGSLADNQQGLWNFISSPQVTKVPFDKGYYLEYKVTQLSEFWLSNGGPDFSTPLPVKLMRVIATRRGADAVISWTVGSETAVQRYEVEVARGNDGLQAGRFQKLGEVNSVGNTTTTRSYSFTDLETDKLGVRYYRLKIVNTDGLNHYSPVRAVQFDDVITWQVYPNPSQGAFAFVYQLPANENLGVRLYDAKGSLVKEISSVATGFLQKLNIDISANNYATGVYLLRVRTGEREQVFKLYKQ